MGLFDFFKSTPSESEKPPIADKKKEKEKQWKDPNEKEKYVCEAVAQEGLSIFYTVMETINPDEILQY